MYILQKHTIFLTHPPCFLISLHVWESYRLLGIVIQDFFNKMADAQTLKRYSSLSCALVLSSCYCTCKLFHSTTTRLAVVFISLCVNHSLQHGGYMKICICYIQGWNCLYRLLGTVFHISKIKWLCSKICMHKCAVLDIIHWVAVGPFFSIVVSVSLNLTVSAWNALFSCALMMMELSE